MEGGRRWPTQVHQGGGGEGERRPAVEVGGVDGERRWLDLPVEEGGGCSQEV